MNTKHLPSVKVRKSHKPVYPDYISVEMLDAVIKSGTDPLTMMQEMKKALMERVMEAELNHHMKHEKHEKSPDSNYRNGYGKKSVCMDDDELDICTHRDRNGEFEAKLLPKHQRHFKGFDEKIISMYGMGMSTRDIAAHLRNVCYRSKS